MAKPATALKIVAKPPTTGELIDQLEDNRAKRRLLEAQVKPLEEEYKALKLQIMERLDAEKSEKGASKRASVSITTTTVPLVKNTVDLVKWLIKTKNTHLFLAQPLSTPSWRELREREGQDLPGTETFVKRDLNHASIKAA